MLIRPILTEKSVRETSKHRFTFEVGIDDTKTNIKKLVEKTFGVNVVKIQTLVMPGKAYRAGKRWIFKQSPEWKKAVVTLKPGQKIELFGIEAQGNK